MKPIDNASAGAHSQPMKKNSAAKALGSLGGKVKGKSKARGDSDYYRKLAAKRKKKGITWA